MYRKNVLLNSKYRLVLRP